MPMLIIVECLLNSTFLVLKPGKTLGAHCNRDERLQLKGEITLDRAGA